MKRLLAAAALACAAALPISAEAGPLVTLSGTYDAFLQNSVFTIDNLSSSDIDVTLLTNLGPTTSVEVGEIDAGGVYQYAFNALNGGYEIDPQGAGIPDTTLYELVVTINGAVLDSGWFSPISNLSGGYVDFLGNTCYGLSGCPVVQNAIVAEVPEPAGAALFGLGMAGIALVRRRRAA